MDQMLHQPDEMAGYLGYLMHRRRAESSSTLLQYFGFKEDPFRVSPDARYMFPSQTHLEALASLENGFYNDRGFIAMIAPPGMGKTTLLYKFLEDTQATARSVFLFDIDPECEPRDFVGYILRDFGITPGSTSSEMHSQLGEALVRETEAGRKCVVVIDEAQNLSDAVLERVRLLTNFETTQGKLLQIILSGQPQLTDKLLHGSLVQLRQRVSTVCRLELLSGEEVVAYIDYRLTQAGYSGDPLFTEDALQLIVEKCNGTPRTINNLCYNALALCCEKQSKQVDREMVAKVAANLQFDPQTSETTASDVAAAHAEPRASRHWKPVQRLVDAWDRTVKSPIQLWVPATLGVLFLCVLGVFRLGGVGSTQPRNLGEERPLILPHAAASAPTPAEEKSQKAVTTRSAPSAKPVVSGSTAGNHVSTAQLASATGSPGTIVAAANPATLQQSPVTNAQRSPAPTVQNSSRADAPAPARASLSIDSIPFGADIEINGAFVGNTPSMVTLAAGSYRITVSKKGYETWNKTLSVSSGIVHLNAELEQAAEQNP